MSGKVVFINGPPRSGKDTAGNLIQQLYPSYDWHIEKFANPITDFVGSTFHLQPEDLEYLREEAKDVPKELFRGMSMRQVMISFSENYMKPTFGEDVFGVLAAYRLDLNSNYIFTDCGFEAEMLPVARLFGVENCFLLSIYRDGCDFQNDSRNRITEVEIFGQKLQSARIENNYSFTTLGLILYRTFANYFNLYGQHHEL